jgi:hypothetical protein
MIAVALPAMLSTQELFDLIPVARASLGNNLGIAAFAAIVTAFLSWLAIYLTAGWAGRQAWNALLQDERFGGRHAEL